MSRSHLACFKHMKRNCKCGSPKHLNLHHSIRVPPDGKKQEWKEFKKFLLTWNRKDFNKILLEDDKKK